MKTATLPLWLQENNSAGLPKYKTHWFGKDYLEKTLQNINRVMAEDACSVRTSGYVGILQRIQAPVKLAGILALIMAAALTRSLIFLFLLNFIILGVALQSGIGCKAFGVRVWIPTFLFAGVAVLPGIVNWVTPGESLYILYTHLTWQFGPFTLPADLTITRQGVKAAAFVLLRAAASLGLATLIIKTTRWALLTKALAKFGLPAGIVTVLDLTYRYIYVFLLLLIEYLMGRRSRLVGLESEAAKLAWIGGTIAAFLRMTWTYSQDINYAMVSRGYSGEYYAEPGVKLQLLDICFLFTVMVLCFCAYGGTFYAAIFHL